MLSDFFNPLLKLIGLQKPSRIENTLPNNLKVWSNHDWNAQGEEWSNNPEWKQSLIDHVLHRHIPQGSSVLEIGPGAGRWTEHLLKRAEHLQVVDLVPKCIELCKERFAHAGNVEYFVNNGCDLSFISAGSVDRIWSFDVFVHILARDVERYVKQFSTILKPGGRAIIHHGRIANRDLAWRSDMRAETMVDFAGRHRLHMVDQITSWAGGKVLIWPDLPPGEQPDVISILERPFP